jgi:hypothetical protein
VLTFKVFNPLADLKQGDYPLSPQVRLRTTLESGTSATTADVSPLLATDIEVDESINRVIQQLEQLRIAAKRALASTKARLLSSET